MSEEPEELSESAAEMAEDFADADMKMACVAAVRKHYAEFGATNWKLVMEQFPKMDTRRFWRIVAKVKQGVPDADILKATIAYAKHQAAKKVLPASPSPALIYAGGADAKRQIDYMGQLQEMLNDIRDLRDMGLSKPDENGVRKITNTQVFAQAIKLRGETLDRALKAYETVWDLRKMRDFYDTIIEEVGNADPVTAARIMDRLHILNNQRGLTIDAKIEI